MSLLSELGVNFQLSEKTYKVYGKQQIEKKCKLQFSRAVALSLLSVLVKKLSWKISVFDAIQDFGLAGMQWYKYLNKKINIVINIPKQLEVELCANLVKNSPSYCSEDVKVVSEIPQAHLHKNKYSFVYVEVCGSAIVYFDSAMNSIKHGGLICVTSTDVAILQNKSPDTVRRLYEAKLWKTEYSKELGVRVILANLARAAARWCKGIKVELCVGLEHGFTVVCRVFRGSRFGEKSMTKLEVIAHCQLCQARAFIPDSLYFQDVTSLNLCNCSNNGIKAPILQLGPAWNGTLYDQDFLFDIYNEMKHLELNSEYVKLIEQLILESACCKSVQLESELVLKIKKHSEEMQEDSAIPSPKKVKLELTNTLDPVSTPTSPLSNSCLMDSFCNGLVSSATAFYFDFQNHSVKGCNPPTLASVISTLRTAGYSASRSHFGPRCVRTTANLQEFKNILTQISKATKK